jgi:hypothetical protein
MVNVGLSWVHGFRVIATSEGRMFVDATWPSIAVEGRILLTVHKATDRQWSWKKQDNVNLM